MLFREKQTPTGQVEVYTDGSETKRFIATPDTLDESNAVRASLANLALSCFGATLGDSIDAKLLLDYLSSDRSTQNHLVLSADQAERLARLIKQNAASSDAGVIDNQFSASNSKQPIENGYDSITALALNSANQIETEVAVRRFRGDLDETVPENFLD